MLAGYFFDHCKRPVHLVAFRSRKWSLCFRTTFLIFFTAILPLQADAFSNVPEDFRGIKWGASVKDTTGLIFEEQASNNRIEAYWRQNDEKKIGDATVDAIGYGFSEDRFCVAAIDFQSQRNFESIKEHLFSLHGKTEESDKWGYVWEDESVWLRLTYDRDSDKGKLQYAYVPILKAKGKGQQNRLYDAIDFFLRYVTPVISVIIGFLLVYYTLKQQRKKKREQRR